jgi:hypothetical protein
VSVRDEARLDAYDFIRQVAPLASGAAVDRAAEMLAASVAFPDRSFRIETWADFRDHTAPDVPYVIDGVMPVGAVGLLGAAAKNGKTWIGLHTAVCVATAKPFLGRFAVPTPQPVVYVALEGARANLRARIGALTHGLGLDPEGDDLDGLHLLYKPRIDLRNAELTDQLVDELLALGPGLVVFDVLRKAALVRESNEGAGDFRAVLENTRTLGEADCAALYPHHNTKANADTDKRIAGERLSGSGALYGHADFGIFITSYQRVTRTLAVEFSTRDEAELGEITVRLVGDGTGRHGGFTYTDRCVVTAQGEHDTTEQREETTEHAIRTYLREHGGASQTAITDAAGGKRTNLIATLTRMITTGTVVTTNGKRRAILHWLADDPTRPVPMVRDAVGTGGDSSALSPPGFPRPPLKGRREGEQVKSTESHHQEPVDTDDARYPE